LTASRFVLLKRVVDCFTICSSQACGWLLHDSSSVWLIASRFVLLKRVVVCLHD